VDDVVSAKRGAQSGASGPTAPNMAMAGGEEGMGMA